MRIKKFNSLYNFFDRFIYTLYNFLLKEIMLKYLLLSNFIFITGLVSIFFNRKHIINVLIAIELILLSININFLVFSSFLDDILGQIYAIILLSVIAGESAIGLAIVVVYFNLRGNVEIDYINHLKG